MKICSMSIFKKMVAPSKLWVKSRTQHIEYLSAIVFLLSAQESAQGIISSFVFGAICNEDAHRVLNGPRNPNFISLSNSRLAIFNLLESKILGLAPSCGSFVII